MLRVIQKDITSEKRGKWVTNMEIWDVYRTDKGGGEQKNFGMVIHEWTLTWNACLKWTLTLNLFNAQSHLWKSNCTEITYLLTVKVLPLCFDVLHSSCCEVNFCQFSLPFSMDITFYSRKTLMVCYSMFYLIWGSQIAQGLPSYSQ